nr:SDR family NAD(P)-dependent oxidoreductase [Acidobacteriota bacterium]
MLRKKTVVVTGASSGIGRAAALEFARRGANLVLAARRVELLEEVARGCRELGVDCTTVVTDVTRRADCERLIEIAGNVDGNIDVLVNNA